MTNILLAILAILSVATLSIVGRPVSRSVTQTKPKVGFRYFIGNRHGYTPTRYRKRAFRELRAQFGVHKHEIILSRMN